MERLRGRSLVVVVCVAQVLAQIGAFSWPALMPMLAPRWDLSNSAAGWITGIFYLAYALAVPILVTLTDRVDPRRIYLFGVACTVASHALFAAFAEGFWSALALRALAGIGWAGTYMTGVKLLADQVDAKLMSRAVAGHAASIGISGALSFAWAGLLTSAWGWEASFAMSAAMAVVAWALVAVLVPPARPRPAAAGRLFDFRPVLANRAAMAYAVAYGFHTLEMNALRGWGVAFLGFVLVGAGAGEAVVGPALVMTGIALAGTLGSVGGNEIAMRFGRRRLIGAAIIVAAVLGTLLGFVGPASYGLAIALMTLYGLAIWIDSASLTAGAAGAADPARRGATLAIHSMLGYLGGFVGPLLIGFVLDLAGGPSSMSWGLAFTAIGALGLAALVAFHRLGPGAVPGDQASR